MPEPIETDPNTAARIAETLAGQAATLHYLFMRTFGDILSGKVRSHRDVGRALKAQAQCRAALRLLRALREAKPKKSRNRTNGLLEAENRHHDQALEQAPTEACPQGLVPPKLRSSEGWMVPRAPRPSGGAHPRRTTMEKNRPAREQTRARPAPPRTRSSTASEAALSSSGSARSGSSYTTPRAPSRWAKPSSGLSTPGQLPSGRQTRWMRRASYFPPLDRERRIARGTARSDPGRHRAQRLDEHDFVGGGGAKRLPLSGTTLAAINRALPGRMDPGSQSGSAPTKKAPHGHCGKSRTGTASQER